MADTILTFIFMIPLYGVLIWTYFYPEESMLFGQRWMYKEEPEFSEIAIAYTKFASMVAIFLFTIILISSLFDNYLLRLILALGLICYIVYSFFRLRKKLLE